VPITSPVADYRGGTECARVEESRSFARAAQAVLHAAGGIERTVSRSRTKLRAPHVEGSEDHSVERRRSWGRSADAIDGARLGIGEGERCAVLDYRYTGRDPSFGDLAEESAGMAERQFPRIVHDEALRPIVVGRTVLLAQTARVVAVGAVTNQVGQRLAPGVGGLEGDAMRKLFARGYLKTVVIG